MEALKHKKRLIVFSTLTLIIMLGIFMFSSQNGNDSRRLSSGFLKSFIGNILENMLPRLTDKGFDYDIRKYGHMFEYFCLGVSSYLLFYEIFIYKRHRPLITAAVAAPFCFLYACSDEFHQRFVPGRAGCFKDVLIDSAGFFTAIIIMLLFFAAGRCIKARR